MTTTTASGLRIAIDGPAGAGKSTVARRVAERLGYTYVDTGAMYRAVAWSALDRGVDVDDDAAVCAMVQGLDLHLEPEGGGARVIVNGKDITAEIRTAEISRLTSPISALPCVRAWLLDLQRAAGASGGVVMEGRDIGTVVLPNADLKVYLTASIATRARRRDMELAGRGTNANRSDVEREIAERDGRDRGRDVAPLVAAADAVRIESDSLSADEVAERIVSLAERVIEQPH